ncbi:acetamidase [Punctularia strigosozonata HHB-11173 SS5]|uniref:amidase n=1 Tax=Punctularia strigosozonata (strain HHB-11173) TaxID=741275 RepID=R7S3U4_PUNST|nr:acetamidase [Punctularia strigosozonata HHB-11173 SS5]EIN05060.1 acetamidase [Punctularia strigosozonata HHB-11173 SS5]
MVFFLGYLAHRRDCRFKQAERQHAIASLPAAYHTPLTSSDIAILNTPVASTASNVRAGAWSASDVLKAYGKRALEAHQETNCLTEVMIGRAEALIASAKKGGGVAEVNFQGSLAGVPVSLKDITGVAGYDACMGHSKLVGKPFKKDAALVRLLKDAGAVPFVKTNIPITLLSFESTNDVFGRTSNPFNKAYSPGGSTGGESALLAFGGSRIGIGTDVAGSVRVPSHYSGIYTIKCSTGRMPRTGCMTTMPGQEGVPAVYSPMTRTLEDLGYFLKSIVDMKPWTYDHSCHPIPWRGEEVKKEMEDEKREIRWGVLWTDGVVDPTPACLRALQLTVDALSARGDSIINLSDAPSPYRGLRAASILLNNDGCSVLNSFFRSYFEWNDPGVARMLFAFRVPAFIKRVYAWLLRTVWKDEIWAGLVERWNRPTTPELWGLVKEREGYRAEWYEYMKEKNVDYVLCVPNAAPAVPAGGMYDGFCSCGYTFLWNLLDYSAGVMPVTNVDAALDAVPRDLWKRMPNSIAKGAWKMYDAKKMEGLPVGVEVVGRRLEEEKVFWGMERIKDALTATGVHFKGIEVA